MILEPEELGLLYLHLRRWFTVKPKFRKQVARRYSRENFYQVRQFAVSYTALPGLLLSCL